MRGIIDRFEGELAVVELDNQKMVNIERVKLPKGAQEGDCLIWVDDCIYTDQTETEKRRTSIKKLMDDLFNA